MSLTCFDTKLLIAAIPSAICRVMYFGIITHRFSLEHSRISARQFQAPMLQQAEPLLIRNILRRSCCCIRIAQPLLLPAVPRLTEYQGQGAQADD